MSVPDPDFDGHPVTSRDGGPFPLGRSLHSYSSATDSLGKQRKGDCSGSSVTVPMSGVTTGLDPGPSHRPRAEPRVPLIPTTNRSSQSVHGVSEGISLPGVLKNRSSPSFSTFYLFVIVVSPNPLSSLGVSYPTSTTPDPAPTHLVPHPHLGQT